MASENPERITLDSEQLRCEVLPGFGGKIASLQWRGTGTELLQAPLGPYRERAAHGGEAMPFDQSDAGGWDECLPTVAGCRYGAQVVPDHGDLWGVPWQVVAASPSEATLTAETASLPLRFTRRIALEGAMLRLDYAVENLSPGPVPYLYSTHPLFAVEAGDQLRLAPGIHQLTVEGSGGDRLGKHGTTVGWPFGQEAASGQATDLSLAKPADAAAADKLFAAFAQEGWAEIDRPRAGFRLRMSCDPSELPFLGLWLCYGGWPERPDGPHQQCMALEPTTCPYDSLEEALASGKTPSLAPGEQRRWTIEVKVRRL